MNTELQAIFLWNNCIIYIYEYE